MKIRVVSIDVLVTVAVIGGAFLLQNFEESAIVTFLFLFGAFLEQRTLNKTRSAIKELTEMAPESALKQMENGVFEEVLVDEVDVGDILLVKTGAKFLLMEPFCREKATLTRQVSPASLSRLAKRKIRAYMPERFWRMERFKLLPTV
ncbi:hypothetical protein [Methanoculleus chikugoensis]|uniref:hypothetical protein n=1 Tax=Methanoculleus chikugoensis TaxID=118126 RepID=UPI000A48C399|nr:hypothetical protein [Methanoculleus chikugoensis]